MMKKILWFLAFLSLFFLTACGGSNDNPAPKLSKDYPLELFTGSGFEIYAPEKWTASGSESLPKPYMGDIVLSIRSPQKRYGFSNNLLILKKKLDSTLSSLQYSMMNYRATKGKYIEYEKIDARPINFGDSDTSRVYVYDAKYNQKIQKLRFIETAKMCGTTVYMLHFTIALDRSPEDYIKLLSSFRCK